MQYFRSMGREISVDVSRRKAGDVYGELVGRFWERAGLSVGEMEGGKRDEKMEVEGVGGRRCDVAMDD